MVHVVYYSPSIPKIESTARHANATAFPVNVDTTTLITESEPPTKIVELYDEHYTVDGGTIDNGRRAATIANDVASEETLYVTTFHYAPVLSGVLADLPWVVDIYDDPMQYALNNPRSHHIASARVLSRIIGKADGTVHSYHPHAGNVLGSDPRFVLGGCPATLMEPTFEVPDDTIRGVWAGSPRMDRGMPEFLTAVKDFEGSIKVDVFGQVQPAVTELVQRLGLIEDIRLHGRTPHEPILKAISSAHVGFSTLPARSDWVHSTPVKVREYMAGGSIPIVSPFPGMRLIAQEAAVYTKPKPEAIRETLSQLKEISAERSHLFREKMEKGRRRAEMLSLDRTGEWFVKQCVSSGLGIELF